MNSVTSFITYPTNRLYADGEMYYVTSIMGVYKDHFDFYRFVERVSNSAYQIIHGGEEYATPLYYDKAEKEPASISISEHWKHIKKAHRRSSSDEILYVIAKPVLTRQTT